MTSSETQSGDRLLWLGAAVVAAMGLAWLVIEAPWSSDEAQEPVTTAVSPGDSAIPPTGAGNASSGPSPDSDPLYLARLALDTGMLVEPAEYSAWTLFGAAVDAEPGHAEASEGLELVATALLGHGRTALEQGRLDDAEGTVNTIFTRLPAHAGALALAADIEIARRPPPVIVPARRERSAESAPPEPDPAERIPEIHAAFLAAMGRNAVLTPSGASARDYLSEMIGLAAGHELTIAARELLVTELLDRSAQALEALDAAGAEVWIDAATPLAADPAVVARARERLTRHLIETASKKRLPVSALAQTLTVAPHYPESAIDRDIEGWVDLEFVVTPAGDTAEISVTGASHERYFRDEAVAAVAQWRFEPVVFMGQAISQLAYTRLAFVLD